LKVALVVHGRFHGFDLARAMIARGHDVTVLTNYPHWATRRFGLADENVRSYVLHGLTARMLDRAQHMLPSVDLTAMPHKMFGKWAADQVKSQSWDLVHVFSSVAEEILAAPRTSRLRTVVRGSSHILTQARLLEEEAARTGEDVEHPSPWTIAREQREYRLADAVIVLSTFAKDSFVAEGFPEDRLYLLRLGVDTTRFRPKPETVEKRRARILAGEPLRVIMVGAMAARKGALDFVDMVNALPRDRFRFQVLGVVTGDGMKYKNAVADRVEFAGRRPQAELPRWYADADIFVFPTIEDGFAVVLAQANANALPIITTTNCSGPDILKSPQSGWVVPIRSGKDMAERLLWCDSHRGEVAAMVSHLYETHTPRTWNDVAMDFEQMYTEMLERHRSGSAAS
jgi:glycosyltransferase involved in cell wall biosynthesis